MVILTAKQMLQKGLTVANVSRERQRRLSMPTQYRKFKAHYGIHPLHAARVWRDFHVTTIAEAHVNNDANVLGFLAALNFLKVYASEDIRADFMGDHMHLNQMRDETWMNVRRMAALKPLKIVWPDHWETTFIGTVDGTHIDIQEPRDPEVRKNRMWYSHKSNTAALNYEIAVAIFESKIVHAKCGDPASTHDLTVFRMELSNKIPPGKRVIADKAYISKEESHVLSTYNQFDSEEVKEFKRRAKARQECLNAKLKEFNCVSHEFRHKGEKAQLCFDAVIVLVQYVIEDTGPHGQPLFDV